MAAIETSHTGHGPTGRIGTILATLAGALAAWNDARRTRKALSALTDRELEDIGLTRADIEAVATGRWTR